MNLENDEVLCRINKICILLKSSLEDLSESARNIIICVFLTFIQTAGALSTEFASHSRNQHHCLLHNEELE